MHEREEVEVPSLKVGEFVAVVVELDSVLAGKRK